MLLAVVGGEDGNFGRRVAAEPHKHKRSDDILGLCQVLVKIRARLGLSHSVEVSDIDQLKQK